MAGTTTADCMRIGKRRANGDGGLASRVAHGPSGAIRSSIMIAGDTDFEIKAESRGAHWIAWLTRGSSDQPLDSIILVGQTREEAESKARVWADKLTADPLLIRG